jgi:hypothetical protein
MKYTIIQFCEKYEIKWFPISLTIIRATDDNEGSKTLNNINHPFYKGITQKQTPTYKPMMTDFELLDETALKKRQSLIYDDAMVKKYNLNCIAMDTSEYHHIDVDTKNYDEQYDEMKATYPSFSSMRKPYGFHIIVKSADSWKPTKNRLQFKDDKGVELLCGQWSYAPLYIDNHDENICELEEMGNFLIIEPVKTPKSPTTIIEGINSDDDLPIKVCKQNNLTDYNEILDHTDNIDNKYLCSGQYEDWIKIIWALRSTNDVSYKNIAIKLAKRCGRDIKTYVDTYWNNYIDKGINDTDKGINVGTIFYYSLESNKSQYLKMKMKYSPSIEKKIFDNLTLDNMIKTACESDFADIYYETYKKNLVGIDDKIYIYYNKEWRVEDENKPHILLNNINEWLKSYIKCCFTFLGQQKANAIDDKEEMKKLKELDDLIIKVNQGIKRVNFCKNVLTFIRSKLAVVFDKPVFDIGEQDHNNIHFKNGVYEMKNKIFRERCFFDYITKWLDYDYIHLANIDKNITDKVNDFFEKTQPDKKQREFTLGYLSYCLSGSVDKQRFKMNVGYSASNGKSTEMSIHDMCFPIYTKKIVSETFVLGYAKRHKHVIDLLNNPIRLAYVEELPEKKLDIEFVKDFVDAKKISCEVMFGTDQVKKIQAKLMTCSNHDFHGKTDEGLKRRGLIQHYNSRFLKDDGINEFSDEKHIYKRVDGFEKQFNCPYFKNAYFHLLLKYYDNLIVPKINEDKFKEVCDDNDYFKNKLLEVYEITEDYECKVFWKDIAYLFGQQINKEDRKSIDGDMKRLIIPYGRNESVGKGRKGCYLGLKLISVEEVIEEENM